MTREEIIQAISDDKTMPFIQPDQLDEIVDFVIKNYKPSLPSDLDEAAHSYAWEKQEHHIDFDGDEYLDYGPRYDAFKAGAEWMAGQGVCADAEICKLADRAWVTVLDEKSFQNEVYDKFKAGDKVVVQIRKK